MLEKIPGFVLKNRVLLSLALIIVIVIGIWSATKLAVDVYPNLNAPVVTVVTENHGMAPEEIESLITLPLETAFNSLPYIKRVRSNSLLGISLVFVEFEYGVDIYFARQLISEKMQLASARLPDGTEAPFLGPVSSMFADAVEITISGGEDLYEIRDLADWTIKQRLQTISGVSNVINFGGLIRQYHVILDPNKLINYGISVKQINDVLIANNKNFTGGYLIENASERLIRGLGRINSIEDIENIIVTEREGIPIMISQVADVEIGSFLRRGAASENGQEVVSVTVQNQFNANVMNTIDGVMAELDRMKSVLGENVKMEVFYAQLDMIMRAVSNVGSAIMISIILVVIVLFVFLGNFRTTLITALTIPFSLITAFIFMRIFGLSFNIMTMGGLAIGIGMIVDASVIMTENIFRHLQIEKTSKLDAIKNAASEVSRPIVFATMIVIAAFAPVFTLQDLEGKMFVPLAITVTSALVASLFVTLTFSIIICSIILNKKTIEENKSNKTIILRFIERLYNPLLEFSFKFKGLMITIGMVLFFTALFGVFNIGTEFMPVLDESSLVMDIVLPPGTSLNESSRMANLVSKEVSSIPEVIKVVSRTGRAEGAEHAEPVNLTEANVVLIPKEDREKTIHEIESEIRGRVGEIPGVLISLNSPLQHRINHTLTGTKAAIAVKLFGDDFITLQRLAKHIKEIVEETPGAVDVFMEQSTGIPQLQIELEREKIARYGINVNDVADVIETALNGITPTEIIKTRKRYDIFVRFEEKYRSNEEMIKNILIDTPSGVRVPLVEIAHFHSDQGPSMIRKESTIRRIMVQCNVDNRDMGSVVNDIREGVSALDLPEGYFVDFGGTYENQTRAMRQLLIVVIITVIIVFILLYTAFNSIKDAFLIVFNVPHAMVGGVLLMLITGVNLSVPAIIGFIALTGICVQDGIVLINHINHNRKAGIQLKEAVIKAGNTKLRPVLITTFTTILGLLPIVLSTGTASEIQKPLGMVLIAGLIFSTFLTLVVLPMVYILFDKSKKVKI